MSDRATPDYGLRQECADCGPVAPEFADAHDEHHAASPESDAGLDWYPRTPEALRLLAIETRKVEIAEATYGLDKRQARRVRRRMARPLPPGVDQGAGS